MTNDNSDDEKLWKHVTENVEPLHVDKKVVVADKKISEIHIEAKTSFLKDGTATKRNLPEIKHSDIIGIDKSTAKRLKDGKFNIEAKLDLHGQTQGEAFEALKPFINASYDAGRRCVLIVTGKGTRGEGVLRKEVPRWLNLPEMRSRILFFSYAQTKDGGDGALYVLLKRKRSIK